VRTKGSYYQAQFQRLRHRRGAKKAIYAVAASILTANRLRKGAPWLKTMLVPKGRKAWERVIYTFLPEVSCVVGTETRRGSWTFSIRAAPDWMCTRTA
jgi:hypothetical protein